MFKRMTAAAVALALGAGSAAQAELISLPIAPSNISLGIKGVLLSNPLNANVNIGIGGVVNADITRAAGNPSTMKFLKTATFSIADANNLVIQLTPTDSLIINLIGTQFVFEAPTLVPDGTNPDGTPKFKELKVRAKNPDGTDRLTKAGKTKDITVYGQENDPITLTPAGQDAFGENLYTGDLSGQKILLNSGVAQVSFTGSLALFLPALGPGLNDDVLQGDPMIYDAATNTINYNFGINPVDATLPAGSGIFTITDGMTKVDKFSVPLDAVIKDLINALNGGIFADLTLSGTVTAVPEVGSMVMMAIGAGLVGLVGFRRYRRSA